MIRKAFKMSVHEDQHEEYARRHNPIWRELEDTLLDHGVRSYSIYLDPATSELFGYAEIESEERWAAVASTDVCQTVVAAHEGPDAVEPRRQPRLARPAGGLPHRAPSGLLKRGLGNAGEPVPRRLLPLARRPRLRQLLRALPGGEEVGLGGLLARRGLLQLDHRPLDPGLHQHPRPAGCPGPDLRLDLRVDLVLGRHVGPGRADLRPHHALPRNVARHGGRPRLLRRVRHPHAADLPRRVREQGARHDVRPGHPARRRRLPRRHRHRRLGGHVQRARDDRGAEEGDDQGVQLQRRASSSPRSPG